MKSGELADKNHVTYSTRYSEGNTGLIYYTYRHYAPRLYKWINKDPIAEQGGINLYQMVGNDTICNWDTFGGNSMSFTSGAFSNWISGDGKRMSIMLSEVIPDKARDPSSYDGFDLRSQRVCQSKSMMFASFSEGFQTSGFYGFSIGGLRLALIGMFLYDEVACSWSFVGVVFDEDGKDTYDFEKKDYGVRDKNSNFYPKENLTRAALYYQRYVKTINNVSNSWFGVDTLPVPKDFEIDIIGLVTVSDSGSCD